jgi:hypothetical protein
MKKLIFVPIYLLLAYNCSAQKVIKKSLYFNQDTSFFLGCGVITHIDILYFVSDTSLPKNNKNDYYLAVKCASSYGKVFFRKGQKYSMLLTKNFKEVKSLIPLDTFKEFSKDENFYYAKNIVFIKKTM